MLGWQVRPVGINPLPSSDWSTTGPSGLNDPGFSLTTTMVVKCKQGGKDIPYVFDKSKAPTTWRFVLAYAQLHQFMSPTVER
eukprot:457785-Prorocentrum_minimum.AAC.1